ncbi:MAG: hypothetical protein RLZZ292_1035 [Bacteroidota bacterium]|jgi:signal transduction histidine kinase
MLNNFYLYLNEYLIPNNLKDNPLRYRKAKILTYSHLFLIFMAVSLAVTDYFFTPENHTPIIFGAILLIGLLFIFKHCGSLVISGNLLACVNAFVMGWDIPLESGLHSDNLLWMIFCPIFAMLLAGRRSGYFWIVALSLFTTFLYSYQITHPEADWQSRLHVSPTYYYISYLSLFLIIFGVVVIFESGQSLIIQLLRDNKKQLELQQTEIVRRSQELEAIENKLRNTNLELENFAYAASHDLKEPLRMIGMYTQLIQRRIKGQLDENTTEYMYYVTDGVSRMQTLLDDLLNYSRLGKKGVVKSMDLNDTLFVVMNNLAATIKETQATIVVDHLPTVVGNSTEMIQLFQNLIANSIKFRQKESTPIIEITHTEKDETITFAFKDNGIGIKSDFHEKVFNIFERLHSHSDYEGTGIGLATCKKIVVNHGGQIWVNSEEGAGATFHFTIPKGTLAIAA